MFHRQELIANERIDFYIDSNKVDQLKMLPFWEFRLVLDNSAPVPVPGERGLIRSGLRLAAFERSVSVSACFKCARFFERYPSSRKYSESFFPCLPDFWSPE